MPEESLANKMAQDALINQLNKQANKPSADNSSMPYGSAPDALLHLLGAGQPYGGVVA